MNFTAAIRAPPPLPHTHTFSLFSLYEEDLGGTGPDRIPTLVRAAGAGSAVHCAAVCRCCPSLPTLDDPAPQMVEQLPDIMHFFDTLTPDPEQVIEVPKIFPMMFLCGPACVIRSWWNSWWKCRRSCPIPCCSCLWSRTSTFQFLVVECDLLVFKVFPENRVQQRLFRRRSLTFPFLVVVFKVFALGKVHLLLTLQLSLVHFSPIQKKCGVRSPPESEGARQCQLMDSGRLMSHPCRLVSSVPVSRWRMAACSVLRPRRFSRRLTICDVDVGTFLFPCSDVWYSWVLSRPSLCRLVFMKTWMSLVHFSAMVTGANSSTGVLPVV